MKIWQKYVCDYFCQCDPREYVPYTLCSTANWIDCVSDESNCTNLYGLIFKHVFIDSNIVE